MEVLCPAPEIVISTDRRALRQILLNLANNAIKFTESGLVKIELQQSRSNGDLLTEISVVDTGAGIRLEERAKLFQAFSQLGAGSSHRPEGTGLGLHLSQRLAQLMGGRITVQSEYGKGSRFTLALPSLNQNLQKGDADVDANSDHRRQCH